MQDIMMRRQPFMIMVIIVLLTIQAILGLFFSFSLLARLLAPGSPIIIKGAAIFAGPMGGASLVVAFASLIIAWGVWMAKSWVRFRTVLLELICLCIGVFELVFELGKLDVIRGVCLAFMGVAALIFLCLYVGFGRRMLSPA